MVFAIRLLNLGHTTGALKKTPLDNYPNIQLAYLIMHTINRQTSVLPPPVGENKIIMQI